jgi:OFA family oxalate/formate antiporter-like MFS transporter
MQLSNRWYTVPAGILIQMALGVIYAWSVFTSPLQQAGWTATQTQIVFSAGLASFAIVMVLSGYFLLPKMGPRSVTLLGGGLLGLGYYLGGLAGPDNVMAMTLCVGVLGGAGIGVSYIVPITVGMKWFPDKKGLITGLMVAGFGFGAMLWVKLAGAWGHLITTIGLDLTLRAYGGLLTLMVAIGSLFMLFPPEGWKPKNWTAPTGSAEAVGMTLGQAVRKPQLWFISLVFLLSASAGLMVIGLMQIVPRDALMLANPDLSYTEAAAIAGTAMAIWFSLANGIGRIVWGAISDWIGRKASIIIMTASQGVLLVLLPHVAGNPEYLFAGAALIGFNFGGNFSLFPSMTSDTFGSKFVGQIYPIVFLAYGVAGIFGPMMGGVFVDQQMASTAFNIVGALCVIASVVAFTIRKPRMIDIETELTKELNRRMAKD